VGLDYLRVVSSRGDGPLEWETRRKKARQVGVWRWRYDKYPIMIGWKHCYNGVDYTNLK
jgi:hypothetical protein